MTEVEIAGLHSQVLFRSTPNVEIAGQMVQVVRALMPPNVEIAGQMVQVLIANETLSAGDPMVTVQRKIPGLGWTNLRPKRLH